MTSCAQPALRAGPTLVVHAASSCTNPCNYAHLLRHVVHPYWSADPPEHRLSNKAYKSMDHPTAFVPEKSMLFRVRARPRPCCVLPRCKMPQPPQAAHACGHT